MDITADRWKDYEILDAGNGMKLERWKDVILSRPDPQAIWKPVRPELWRYRFSTIAYRAMSCDVHHSREYWLRQKRRAEVTSFNEEIHTPDLTDTVAEACEKVVSFQELAWKLTGMQCRIASLRCDGYRDREIAAICRLTPGEVALEMNRAQANIVPFPVETAAAAA